MAITIFFDDGGVLNDNEIRGQQWKTYVGEYYSSRFGGEPEVWGEANQKLISSLFDIFWEDRKEKFNDHQSFYNDFKKNMVLGMFKEVGKIPPRNINIEEVFNSAREYVIPKVRSAIPGIIKSVKELSKRGFILFTAAGVVSIEMKMYLEGMGIIKYFKGIYGPGIINTWKSGPDYYGAIFNHSGVEPSKAIIIDDQPRFLNNALDEGANVIQACITGQYEPQFPFFVKNMRDLVPTIENLIKVTNL
jgi:HAD superfamily hydrolase (TIGR01509 family)